MKPEPQSLMAARRPTKEDQAPAGDEVVGMVVVRPGPPLATPTQGILPARHKPEVPETLRSLHPVVESTNPKPSSAEQSVSVVFAL